MVLSLFAIVVLGRTEFAQEDDEEEDDEPIPGGGTDVEVQQLQQEMVALKARCQSMEAEKTLAVKKMQVPYATECPGHFVLDFFFFLPECLWSLGPWHITRGVRDGGICLPVGRLPGHLLIDLLQKN